MQTNLSATMTRVFARLAHGKSVEAVHGDHEGNTYFAAEQRGSMTAWQCGMRVDELNRPPAVQFPDVSHYLPKQQPPCAREAPLARKRKISDGSRRRCAGMCRRCAIHG